MSTQDLGERAWVKKGLADRAGAPAAAPDAEPSTGAALRHGRAVRGLWLLLGFLCVGVGFIGAFVPLLPTTIFMILGAGCFARSSPRLEGWLLAHPRFGPALVAWRAEGAISRQGKRAACIGITIGYGLFWWSARPGYGVGLAVALMMVVCAGWIVTRPLPKDA